MTLSRLAVQEANKNNSSLAQALTDKIKDIADEFTRRGYQATATTLQTSYAMVNKQVNQILQNKNIERQFAEQAYMVYKEMLDDAKPEFNSMIQEIDTLDGNLILKPAYNSIGDIVDKIYTINIDRFYQDYVSSHRFLQSVFSEDYCYTYDNPNNPKCSYTEYAQRIYAINYLIALLAAQLLVFGRKAMLKYQPMVSCYVYDYVCSGCFDIELFIELGSAKRNIATFEFKLYYGDMRTTSLSDLLGQNMDAEYTYAIFDDGIKNTDTTTVKNLVDSVKEFKAKLYDYLNKQ